MTLGFLAVFIRFLAREKGRRTEGDRKGEEERRRWRQSHRRTESRETEKEREAGETNRARDSKGTELETERQKEKQNGYRRQKNRAQVHASKLDSCPTIVAVFARCFKLHVTATEQIIF